MFVIIKSMINKIGDIFNRLYITKGLNVVITVLLFIWVSIDTFFDRFKYNLNTPLENWIDTAVYFNNLLTPVLLLATVFLLYWTWKDTKTALDLQQQELSENRLLFKEQIENQKHKDSLDIYSRRVIELSKKFDLPIRSESLNLRVCKVIADCYKDPSFSKKAYSNFPDEIIRELDFPRDKLNKEDARKMFVIKYLIEHKRTLNNIILSYTAKIKDEEELKELVLKNYKFPVNSIDRVKCFDLFKNESDKIELVAFYRLIDKISQADKKHKRDYVEELLVNFDNVVARKLIELNDNVPNDILKI